VQVRNDCIPYHSFTVTMSLHILCVGENVVVGHVVSWIIDILLDLKSSCKYRIFSAPSQQSKDSPDTQFNRS
jgi:hypothetical protein